MFVLAVSSCLYLTFFNLRSRSRSLIRTKFCWLANRDMPIMGFSILWIKTVFYNPVLDIILSWSSNYDTSVEVKCAPLEDHIINHIIIQVSTCIIISIISYNIITYKIFSFSNTALQKNHFDLLSYLIFNQSRCGNKMKRKFWPGIHSLYISDTAIKYIYCTYFIIIKYM